LSLPASCLPHALLQALSPEQIYKIYQTYIKELSSRLVELNQEACASEDITAQVEKLTKEVVSARPRLLGVLLCGQQRITAFAQLLLQGGVSQEWLGGSLLSSQPPARL
jgi:hypothetical protein